MLFLENAVLAEQRFGGTEAQVHGLAPAIGQNAVRQNGIFSDRI
ncbi:MAG: hypothetical protein AAGC79_09470 [Pseudomonadota bacterium]